MNHKFPLLHRWLFPFLRKYLLGTKGFVFLLFILMSVYPLTVNQAEQNIIRDYYAAAFYFQEGKYEKALLRMKRVVSAAPDNVQYLKDIMAVYGRLDRPRAADAFLQSALVNHSLNMGDSLFFRAWRGYLALKNDDPVNGLSLLEKTLEDIEKYQLDSIFLLSQLNNNRGVAEIFDQAWTDPAHSITKQRRLIARKDYQRAQTYFAKALEINPDNIEAQYNYNTVEAILRIPKNLWYNKTYLAKATVEELDWPSYGYLPYEDFKKEEKNDSIVEPISERFMVFLEALKDYDEVLFLVDISGSMNRNVSKDNSATRMEVMINTLTKLTSALDSTVSIGILTVGGDCDSAPLLDIAAAPHQQQHIGNTLNSLRANGGTPLNKVLRIGIHRFSKNDDKKRAIFLSSDGVESCEKYASSCAIAQAYCDQGIDFLVFSLLLEDKSTLKEFSIYDCLSNACGNDLFAENSENGVTGVHKSIDANYPGLTLQLENIATGELTDGKQKKSPKKRRLNKEE